MNMTNENNPKKDKMPLADPPVRFADMDRYHLKDGIFQVSRKTYEAIDVTYPLANGGSLRVISPKPLTLFDLTLLCVINEQAAKNKRTISPNTKSKKGIDLRKKLELLKDSEFKECLAYETTLRKLIKDMGYSWHGTKSIEQLHESLLRIYSMTFVLTRKTKDGKTTTDIFRIMSSIHLEKYKDKNNKLYDSTLALALNPSLTEALLGHGHYARIDMDIFFNLQNYERLMYAYLCNYVDPGKSKDFSLEELRQIIYGNIQKSDLPSTTSQQQWRAKKLAESICGQIKGWKYKKVNRSTICIKRSAIRGTRQARNTTDDDN